MIDFKTVFLPDIDNIKSQRSRIKKGIANTLLFLFFYILIGFLITSVSIFVHILGIIFTIIIFLPLYIYIIGLIYINIKNKSIKKNYHLISPKKFSTNHILNSIIQGSKILLLLSIYSIPIIVLALIVFTPFSIISFVSLSGHQSSFLYLLSSFIFSKIVFKIIILLYSPTYILVLYYYHKKKENLGYIFDFDKIIKLIINNYFTVLLYNTIFTFILLFLIIFIFTPIITFGAISVIILIGIILLPLIISIFTYYLVYIYSTYLSLIFKIIK